MRALALSDLPPATRRHTIAPPARSQGDASLERHDPHRGWPLTKRARARFLQASAARHTARTIAPPSRSQDAAGNRSGARPEFASGCVLTNTQEGSSDPDTNHFTSPARAHRHALQQSAVPPPPPPSPPPAAGRRHRRRRHRRRHLRRQRRRHRRRHLRSRRRRRRHRRRHLRSRQRLHRRAFVTAVSASIAFAFASARAAANPFRPCRFRGGSSHRRGWRGRAAARPREGREEARGGSGGLCSCCVARLLLSGSSIFCVAIGAVAAYEFVRKKLCGAPARLRQPRPEAREAPRRQERAGGVAL